MRDNFDYAIDLFMQVLSKEPAVYDVRRALRAAQVKKHGTSTGFFKKVLSGASSSHLVAKAQIGLRNNPAEAMHIGEQILNGDPQSSNGHRIVVEAALALEMPKTAVMSLEVLHRNSPNDKDLSIKFANALADIGDVGRAENILAELYRNYPTDQDVALALKNVSARRTMDEGGYDDLADGKGSYRDILKNKDEATALEQSNRQVNPEDVTARLIKEYEDRLKTEPGNARLLKSLGELYTQKKEFDKALACYEKLKGTEAGNDPNLDKAIADTTVRKLEGDMAKMDTTAPDYAEKTARLQMEKEAFQLNECRRRVERFPTDLLLRFELGQLYFNAGKISEAIQEFQKSQNNPHKRVASMSYLAQCFAKRRMFDLAARTLQTAIKEKPVLDEEKKDLVYQLGTVLDSMGKKDEAVEQYKLIYEVDISYRDVAARVDAYYASQ